MSYGLFMGERGCGVDLPHITHDLTPEEFDRVMRQCDYERDMACAFATLLAASQIRADHVKMGDLKRWAERNRAKIDADIAKVLS